MSKHHNRAGMTATTVMVKHNGVGNKEKEKKGFNDSFSRDFMKFVDRTQDLIVNPEGQMKLKYVQMFTLVSATQQFFAYALRTNAAYDVDPLVGSTSTAGFLEKSQFYGYARTIGYDVRVEFCNTSINPCQVFVGNCNTNCGISAGGSSVNLLTLAGNDGFSNKQLAHAYAKSSWTYHHRTTISKVVGSIAPETEDNFRSSVTGIPADLTWLVFGVNSTVSPVSMPVDVTVNLTQYIKMYGKDLLSV